MPGPPPPPPPTVPLPPPPLATKFGTNKTPLETGHTETKRVTEEEFIREIIVLVECFWGRLYKDPVPDAENDVMLVVSMPLETVILQNGPMCGIVALVEALQILRCRSQGSTRCNADDSSNNVCPKTVLEEAILRGVTKQGEMFSVEAMNLLADLYSNGRAQGRSKILAVQGSHEEGTPNLRKNEEFTEIVLHIISGNPVLVPYDADHNHTPCLRKGHAAHWAVLHGMACPVPYSVLCSLFNVDNLPETPAQLTSSSFQVLYSSRQLVILKPDISNLQKQEECREIKLIADLFTPQNTNVLAHQGKSFRAAWWRYVNLLASNQNLREVAPKIMTHKEDFVLHNGIVEGLCSKILLLK